ncbi:MAG: CDP-alcohol phosphatidyltransferase family protein [Myxococcaceae bacterium]
MTANQVTLARIAFLPIPSALLLFADSSWNWVAFLLFVFLGMTDFIDGVMARREGPTKLGGLLDPVADKIMMAAITLSLAGNGWISFWVPAAILSREFLLTVLRSSVAFRGQQVKTSILAKIKTVIQMGGFGTVFMTLFLSRQAALYVSVFWLFFFTAIWAYYALWKRQIAPYWAMPVAGAFLYWFWLLQLCSSQTAILCQCIVIVGITWISAFDYLKTSYAVLKSSGLDRRDGVRLFWALSHSVLSVSVASLNSKFIIPVLVSIAFELGLGGIDNIAVSENKSLDLRIFLSTGLIACLFAVSQTQFTALLLIPVSLIACTIASREVTWRFFPDQ